jgi:toxin FitB
MTYLLDTNVVSELRKTRAGRCDPAVLRWVRSVPPSSTFVSAITVYELERGALLLARRDAVQGAGLRDWLNRTMTVSFRERILPVDADVALKCAALCVPDPRPLVDGLIAATALVHGLTVVTRNVRDFGSTGVQTIDPWSPA